MIGALLVFGFILISLITAITLFLNWNSLKFITLAALFFWSSSAFFLLYNYEGWPTHEDYPRSQIIGIEILEPSENKEGKIFVWVYHVNIIEKHFYEYNPEGTPRVYEIPWSEEKGKAFAKAKEYLEKGYVLYMGKTNESESSEGNKDGVGGELTKGTDGDLLIPYEKGRPNIEALNPRKMMGKDQ